MSFETEKFTNMICQAELPRQMLHEIVQVNISAAKEAMLNLKNQQMELANNQSIGEKVPVDIKDKSEEVTDSKNNDKKDESEGKKEASEEKEQPKAEVKEEVKEQAPSKETSKEAPVEQTQKAHHETQNQHVEIDPKQTENLNLDDVSVVALLSPELKMLLLGGHLNPLFYNSNGKPILEQSVPRTLNIGHETSGVIPEFFQLVVKNVTPAPSTGGPCCVDPIYFSVSTGSSDLTNRQATQIENILNNSFKFTFEYFCNTNQGDIIFSQVGGGVHTVGSGAVQQYDSFTPETFTIKFIVDSDCCCPPLNCDNPIKTINVAIQPGQDDHESFINIPCIDYLLNDYSASGAVVTFLDSTGHEWGLFGTKEKTFELHCIEQTDSPIGYFVHNTSFVGAGSTLLVSDLVTAFNFTYHFDCATESATITFKQMDGISGSLLDNGGDLLTYHSSLTDYNTSEGTINIAQPGDGDDCAPLSCTNVIDSVHIYLGGEAGGFIFNDISDFTNSGIDSESAIDSIYFKSTNGDTWSLLSQYGGYTLVCADLGKDTAPLIFDLDHNGVSISNIKDSSVNLNIDGMDKKVAWVGPEDGLLTYNYAGTGAIESKNFILTENVHGAQTDLQALQILAGQKGGILDMSNPIWDKLGIWQDANQDGKMNSGEYHTLSELKIASINLDGDRDVHYLNGNVIANNVTFNYQDGTTGKAADAILKTEDVVQNNHSIPEVSAPAGAPVTVAANDASSAPAAPLHVDQAVQSAIETQHQVAQTG